MSVSMCHGYILVNKHLETTALAGASTHRDRAPSTRLKGVSWLKSPGGDLDPSI